MSDVRRYRIRRRQHDTPEPGQPEPTIPVEHVSIYKAVRPQLHALLEELRELSKKQPD